MGVDGQAGGLFDGGRAAGQELNLIPRKRRRSRGKDHLPDPVQFFCFPGHLGQLFRGFYGECGLVPKRNLYAAKTALPVGLPVVAGLQNRRGQAIPAMEQSDFLIGNPFRSLEPIIGRARDQFHRTSKFSIFVDPVSIFRALQGIGRMRDVMSADRNRNRPPVDDDGPPFSGTGPTLSLEESLLDPQTQALQFGNQMLGSHGTIFFHPCSLAASSATRFPRLRTVCIPKASPCTPSGCCSRPCRRNGGRLRSLKFLHTFSTG